MTWLLFKDPVSAWTHCAWLMLSFPATGWLLWKSRGHLLKQIGFLAFGLGLVCCYGGSTLWHGYRLHVFAVVDYIGIFLLIAGTTTPVVLAVLRGWWRLGTLAYIWSLAVGGIVVCLVANDMPTTAFTKLYLAMGWGMFVCYFELARGVGHKRVRLVVMGGVAYSLGAIINVARWPVLAPGVFGAHELFHVFVMAGSLIHYWFMVKVVVPLRFRPIASTRPEPAERILKPRLVEQQAAG